MALPLLLAAIALQVEPARLVHGDGARVELRVRADGAPALWASAGAFGKPRRDGNDLRVQWLPPREHIPRVVLIEARMGAERAWATIAVSTKVALQLDTKPNSRVEVRVGGRTFGPVRSDGQGRARVRVVVPPGERTARVNVRDAFGNVNTQSFDLRPPPYQRVRAVAAAKAASWADRDPVRIDIFAVAPDGGPAAAADVQLSADRGSFGEIEQRAPGSFLAWWRAPNAAGGRAHLKIRMAGDKQAEDLAVDVLPGPPARISIASDPSEVEGGAARQVKLRTSLADEQGNAVAAAGAVSFETDLGTVVARGDRDALLSVPAAHGKRHHVRVRAALGSAKGAADIGLRPGRPAQASVELSARAVREGDALDAVVEVSDAGGNLVPGPELHVDAEVAAAGAPRRLDDGRLAVTLRTPLGSGPSLGRVRVRSGEAAAEATFPVISGQDPYGVTAALWLGGHTNFLHAGAGSAAIELAAHPGLNSLEMLGRIELHQFAGVGDSISGSQLSADLRAVAFMTGVRASARLAWPYAAQVSARVGLQRSWGTLHGRIGSQTVAQDTSFWGPAASLGAGASMVIGTGRFMAELQLAFAPARGDMEGNLGGVGLFFGYAFTLR